MTTTRAKQGHAFPQTRVDDHKLFDRELFQQYRNTSWERCCGVKRRVTPVLYEFQNGTGESFGKNPIKNI
ncbi:MAG TPA: hypothetical protein VN911_08535 [Candidatus Acidoferrum sp.]|nr:hypothetical protein [Candidatus Acidoferrum sp.]